MKLIVCFKSYRSFSSDDYTFTFNGIELECNVDRFFSEQSHLKCEHNSGNTTTYVSFGEIMKIVEVSDE